MQKTPARLYLFAKGYETMLNISTDYKKQQKRIQTAINKMLKKGFSIKKAEQTIVNKYGISVRDVGLHREKGKRTYQQYKSKAYKEKAKNQYLRAMLKNKEYYKQARQKFIKNELYGLATQQIEYITAKQNDGLEKLLDNYSNKYFNGVNLSDDDIKAIAERVTGETLDWEHMNSDKWYSTLTDISDYASDIYLDAPDIDTTQAEMDETDLKIYQIGASMYKQNPIW